MALQTTIVRELKFAREVTFIIKLTFITKLTFVIEVAMSNNGQPMQLQKTYYKLNNSSPLSIILTVTSIILIKMAIEYIKLERKNMNKVINRTRIIIVLIMIDLIIIVT